MEIFDYNMEKYLSNSTFNFIIGECCNLEKMISTCNIKIRNYDSDS